MVKILCLASGGGQQGLVLAALGADVFDYIIHPWSNGYVDDVRPVWKECARVLKKNGLLLAGFAIIGFYEDVGGSVLNKYINSSIATKAIKMDLKTKD